MEVRGQFHTLPLYLRGRFPGTCWIGGWVRPKAGFNAVVKEKCLPPTGIEHRYICCLVHSLATILTELSLLRHLLYVVVNIHRQSIYRNFTPGKLL
jgi:hypothetical protein